MEEDNENGGWKKDTAPTDNLTILSSTEDDDYRHKEICGRYIPCSRQPVTRQTTPNSGPARHCESALATTAASLSLVVAGGALLLDTGGEQQIGLHYRHPATSGYKVTRPRAHRETSVLTFTMSIFEIVWRHFVTLRSVSFLLETFRIHSGRPPNFSCVVLM